MRNFGNDSFPSQPYYHHQQPPPPLHPLSLPPAAVKMETYPLTKTIGVGTNLNKQLNKSHFSPVNMITPTANHYHHLGSNNGQSPNNNNGIPINLSHSHTSSLAMSSSHHASILPTAALAAACPTANRGPSPAHQQIPGSGIPYHPSHSPTLPVPNTAVPSEFHNSSVIPATASNGSTSLVTQGAQSPYHPHATTFSKMQPNSSSLSSAPIDLATSTSNESNHFMSSNSVTGCGSNVSSTPPGSSARNALEVTQTHPTTSGGNGGSNLQMNNGTGGASDSNSNTSTGNSSAPRIVSQNVNGTYAVTGIPSNESELQLFRVFQRANLLSYYDMMIELGGDDVQQLCEAGEEEFLEIMALIGMASKPLHVRRLQKALQEWMTQPSIFQSPVLPPSYQHYGVSHIDRTISHTQYTSKIASGNVTRHLPGPVIPIPHLISHNPISPYPAHNAPSSSYPIDASSQSPSDTLMGSSPKNVKLSERSSNSNSPLLTFTPAGGLPGAFIPSQQDYPSTVIFSNPPSYTSGQGQSSNFNSSDHYQNCPSPSGSTVSSSSTVSIKSHPHHQFGSPSPLENSPSSPTDSESDRSNKHEECTSELEVASPVPSYHASSPQTVDNSSGTTTTRVACRSRSCSGSGSEPNSPGKPSSKGIISQTPGSPQLSTESVTNRMIPSSNNSVTGCASLSQDFSSLQDHEIKKLAETAMHLVRSLPQNVKEPKFSRKIETSSYEYIIRLGEDDPRKMDEIRRLSAIFGKNGEQQGKRSKSGSSGGSSIYPKTVSVLELAMNEAAAQLCKLLPALITKRDEMFNLARQVIRDSGLPYAVICASSNLPGSFMNTWNIGSSPNNNSQESVAASRAKIHELRNSSADEEKITSEFAAACKKIKLDIPVIALQEVANNCSASSISRKQVAQASANTQVSELRGILHRKSPPRENNIVTKTALKRMALVASEYRKNICKSSLSVRT